MIIGTAVLCLAINIYHEARSESLIGQLAVATVTMNRAGKDRRKVCDVVFADKQFSWTTGLARKTGKGWFVRSGGVPKEGEAWELAKHIAKLGVSNRLIDYSGGATHYHRKDVRPYWAKTMKRVKFSVASRHVFYRKTNKS